MGINAISSFIDNLIEENEITQEEAYELRETLEFSAKDIEPSRISNFIKTVQERMDAPASGVFSGNGINVQSVKKIVQKAAVEIKNTQMNFRVAKREQEKLEKREANEFYKNLEKEFDKETKSEKEILKDKSEIVSYLSGRMGYNLPSTAIDYMADKIIIANKKAEEVQELIDNGASKEEIDSKVQEQLHDYETEEEAIEVQIGSLDLIEMLAARYMQEDPTLTKEEALKKALEEEKSAHALMAKRSIGEVIQKDSNGNYVCELDDNFVESLPQEIRDEMEQSEDDISKNGQETLIGPKGNASKKYILPSSMSPSKLFLLAKSKLEYNLIDMYAKKMPDLEANVKIAQKNDWDYETNDLEDSTLELLDLRRKHRAAVKKYNATMKELNPEEKDKDENVFLTNADNKQKILNMYFNEGKSAVEIYKEMMKTEIRTYLITDDVIDVIEDYLISAQIPYEEIEEIKETERRIEEANELENVYNTIADNALKKGGKVGKHFERDQALDISKSYTTAIKNNKIYVRDFKSKYADRIMIQGQQSSEDVKSTEGPQPMDELKVENIVVENQQAPTYNINNFKGIMSQPEKGADQKGFSEQFRKLKELITGNKTKDIPDNITPNQEEEKE